MFIARKKNKTKNNLTLPMDEEVFLQKYEELKTENGVPKV